MISFLGVPCQEVVVWKESAPCPWPIHILSHIHVDGHSSLHIKSHLYLLQTSDVLPRLGPNSAHTDGMICPPAMDLRKRLPRFWISLRVTWVENFGVKVSREWSRGDAWALEGFVAWAPLFFIQQREV